MTVEQLIEKLKEFPAWHEVRVDDALVTDVIETQKNRHPFVTFFTR